MRTGIRTGIALSLTIAALLMGQVAYTAPRCVPAGTCPTGQVPVGPGPAGPRGPGGTCSAEQCAAAQPFSIQTQTITAYCPTGGSSHLSGLGLYTVKTVSEWPEPITAPTDLNNFCVTASSEAVTAEPTGVLFGCRRSSSGVQGIPQGAVLGGSNPNIPTDGGTITGTGGVPPYPYYGWELHPSGGYTQWGVIGVSGSMLPPPGTVEKRLRLIYVCYYPPPP